jgi:hypothetical protein
MSHQQQLQVHIYTTTAVDQHQIDNNNLQKETKSNKSYN